MEKYCRKVDASVFCYPEYIYIINFITKFDFKYVCILQFSKYVVVSTTRAKILFSLYDKSNFLGNTSIHSRYSNICITSHTKYITLKLI